MLAVGAAFAAAGALPEVLLRWRSGAGRQRVSTLAALASGCLFALAVRPVVASLHLSVPGTFVALWLLLFVLGFCLSMSEAIAFSEGPSPIRIQHFLGALFTSVVAAGTCALLMRAPSGGSLVANLETWLDRYGWSERAMRLFGTAVAFMVAYCVIGSVTWRFVRPYYTDPKLGLRLRVPPGPIVVLLQIGRGLLTVCALAPLLAASSAHGLDWWTRFAPALAVTCGVIPLLSAAGWPVYLRVVHAIEIVVFALVYAFALGRILQI